MSGLPCRKRYWSIHVKRYEKYNQGGGGFQRLLQPGKPMFVAELFSGYVVDRFKEKPVDLFDPCISQLTKNKS